MSDPDDLLARATRELRDADEPGWDAVAPPLLAALRATARRTVPVRARPLPPDEDAGHQVRVGDGVVKRLIADALERVPGVRPVRVDLRLDGEVCVAATVHLHAEYGTDLLVACHDARRVAAQVLDEVLGTPAGAVRPVDVAVEDLDPASPDM